ncbi:MAG: hypothetical protein GXY33_11610 [Phycisphaerae bacterium]|nr:hypothetical protein [Phycisphaerae bacterium]
MATRVYELNDGWEFAWTQYATKDREVLTPEEQGRRVWREATVPGSVQADLHRHGLVEDPFFADNLDHYRWCEEVDFWYRRPIGPVEIPDGQRALLHFEGLDTFATVWIDGRRVGQHSNMFVPYWVDITSHLRADRPVELMIRFGSSLFECDFSDRDPCQHPPLQRTRTRKAQISYGWDIGPRLVTVGPWRPARIELVDRGRILYAGARTVAVKGGRASMEAVLTVDWHGQAGKARVTGSYGGTSVDTTVDVTGGLNDVVIPFEMAQPELWWPNGMGDQHLHDFTAELHDAENHHLDTRRGRFGVCELRMLQEPRDDGGIGLRFTINGRDYFAKGLNWTPYDAMFGRFTGERTRKLVGLAAEANVNMMRVWGGGVYEDEHFWAACDEKGILIWQDFMFACSLYPQDEAYLKLVRREAELVVSRQRGHVSMGVWSGDNEVDWLCGVESGTLISHKVLPEVVGRLDGGRPYVPSSPFSAPGRHSNDPRFGDCHLWNHTIRHDEKFYTDGPPNFVSEIGRISLPSKKTVDSFMPAERQWPLSHPLWYYHSSDTNRWRFYRDVGQVLEGVRNNGYPEPRSLEEMIEVTQKIQADACRWWIEHYGAEPKTWGLLLWNLCDCWPQVSDAVISYDLELKPAYHAIRQSYGSLDR